MDNPNPPGDEDPLTVAHPRPGVTRLELNRPRSMNALDAGLVERLHVELLAAEQEAGCRVVVMAGRGRGFCAGLDLNGYGTAPGADDLGEVHRNLALQQHISSLVQQIRRLNKPVVTEVAGAAAGAGLALVCASDVRIASTDATFTTAFTRIGASGCDMGVSWLLPRLVGAGRAHELMLTSRRFGADEALRIGLLADAVDPAALGGRVDAVIDQMLDASPLGLALTKQGMWLSLESPSLDQSIELENRQQILLSQTEDCRESLAAFREGRPPDYRWS